MRGIILGSQQKKVAPQHIGLDCEIKLRNNKCQNYIKAKRETDFKF